MARLFITPREVDFINDTAKEIVKDVIGQKIFYFPISEIKTNVHDIYEELSTSLKRLKQIDMEVKSTTELKSLFKKET